MAAFLAPAVFFPFLTLSLTKDEPLSMASSFNQNTLQLIKQPVFTLLNTPFNIKFSSQTDLNGDSLSFVLYEALKSRSAFEATLKNILPPVLAYSKATQLTTSSNQHIYQISLIINPTNNSAQIPISFNCFSNCSGVYPLKIVITNTTGQTVASLVTHIVILNSTAGIKPIQVVNVIPVSYRLVPSLSNPNSSSFDETSLNLTSLNQYLSVLQNFVFLNFDLDISPYLINRLFTSQASFPTFEKLATLIRSPQHELISSPYVPINPSLFSGSLLNQDCNSIISFGRQWINRFNPTSIINAWIQDQPLNSVGLKCILANNYNVLIAPQELFQPQALEITATAPFKLNNIAATSNLLGVIADSMANHLNNNDPELSAINVVSELAQVYFDEPNAFFTRSIVLVPPDSLTAQTLSDYLNALSSAPFLTTSTLGNALADTPIGYGYNLKQRQVTLSSLNTTLPVKNIAATHFALSILNLLFPVQPSILLQNFQADLYIAESSSSFFRQKNIWLSQAQNYLNFIRQNIHIVPEKTITLTSSLGKIPVTINKASNVPLISIQVTIQSNGLNFPHGATYKLMLTHSSNTVYFFVKTKGTGISFLKVFITPTGYPYELAQSRFLIHSTAISTLGLILNLAAIALLLIWWIKSFNGRILNKKGAHGKQFKFSLSLKTKQIPKTHLES
jgi:hypothetical protein